MIDSPDVKTVLADLQQRDVVARIWRKDHTVWKPEPREIDNRLGWLKVTDFMREQIPALVSFAEEIRGAGFRHVVLLGMGGASLGTEVLRRTLGITEDSPRLIVLDSTVPDWVQSVTDAIEPASSLFIVASKSGGTMETDSFYRYFRKLVEIDRGEKSAGQNFIAITDEGTSLAKLAEEAGFRRLFVNPSDVGGRYSVLSYFGLVPAALMGIDIKKLLDGVDVMRTACGPDVPARDNMGAWLGAGMAALSLKGRDKLTLVTSPALASFGLWVEQLIAESLGKEGKGIVPVMEEAPMDRADYGDDRLFVCLRLKGDDNVAVDTAMNCIASSEQPVLTLEMAECYDLGAEFFRWEFAVAVAGAVLGIHPFDQPDVQAAKDATGRVLQEYRDRGRLPEVKTEGSLADLLAEAGKGDYLAVMAYLRQTPDTDRALAGLSRKVSQQYRIATTTAYGPRLLHSTGQLHKGGPNSGLFLQITADHRQDIPVPGQFFTFGVLADAEALGDLQTLQSLGRRVIRVHLESGDRDALSALAGLL